MRKLLCVLLLLAGCMTEADPALFAERTEALTATEWKQQCLPNLRTCDPRVRDAGWCRWVQGIWQPADAFEPACCDVTLTCEPALTIVDCARVHGLWALGCCEIPVQRTVSW